MLKSRILLLVFVSFLITPLVVTTSNGNINIAFFFNMNEEENHIGSKNNIYSSDYQDSMFNFDLEVDALLSKNFHYQMNENYSVALNTFSPPPEV